MMKRQRKPLSTFQKIFIRVCLIFAIALIFSIPCSTLKIHYNCVASLYLLDAPLIGRHYAKSCFEEEEESKRIRAEEMFRKMFSRDMSQESSNGWIDKLIGVRTPGQLLAQRYQIILESFEKELALLKDLESKKSQSEAQQSP